MVDRTRQKAVSVSGRGWPFVVSAAIVVASAAAIGCGDSTAPAEFNGVTATAPATVHFTNAGAGGYRQIVVDVKIKNSTSKVITRVTCSESLERFHAATWTEVWSPVCIAIFAASPIQPGATEIISLQIADTPSQYSGFRFTDPDKEYRIRTQMYAGGDDGTAAVSFHAATNAFEVLP